MPCLEPVLTISAGAPCAIMSEVNACRLLITPQRLTSSSLRQFSPSLHDVVFNEMPALFIRIDTRPNVLNAACFSVCRSSARLTSVGTARTMSLAAGQSRDLGLRCVELRTPEIGQAHVQSGAGKSLRRREPDAAGGAGDDCDAAARERGMSVNAVGACHDDAFRLLSALRAIFLVLAFDRFARALPVGVAPVAQLVEAARRWPAPAHRRARWSRR